MPEKKPLEFKIAAKIHEKWVSDMKKPCEKLQMLANRLRYVLRPRDMPMSALVYKGLNNLIESTETYLDIITRSFKTFKGLPKETRANDIAYVNKLLKMVDET